MRRQAGSPSNEWQVLLVQSRWTPDVWLFPKGGVEKDESAKAAAVRETTEEAGVIGDLGPKLGTWTFQSSPKAKQKMWLLFVTTEHPQESKLWKERKKRRRAWHSFDAAKTVLTDIPEETQRPELLQILDAAEEVLKLVGDGALPPSGSETPDSPDVSDSADEDNSGDS